MHAYRDFGSRVTLIDHLHEHPEHAGHFPAGHDFVLISTTDMSSARGEVRARMLQSLVESQGALREQRISLRLLLQNCDSEELTGFATTAPEFVRPVAVAGRVPLEENPHSIALPPDRFWISRSG